MRRSNPKTPFRGGTKTERQRRGLLAKVHIARKDLGLDEELYRDVIESMFDVRSAGDLTIPQLERLVGVFKQWGFRADPQHQAAALRARAREIAAKLDRGEERLQGLCQKICGVSRIDWAHDPEKLERLLAALGKIEREYADGPMDK